MNADSAFQIGASHAVCQDYTLAGHSLPAAPWAESGRRRGPYVILADGCSSSPDTDMGARLLVKAAQQTLLKRDHASVCDLTELHLDAAHRALVWAEMIGLGPASVDATLLTAHTEGELLIVGCTGDGVICFQGVTGSIDVYSISYASGYPFYPSYAHQPERLLALEVEGHPAKEVKHFSSASVNEPLHLLETSNDGGLTEAFTLKARDYKLVALFSDGIHSFFSAEQTETSKSVEAIPLDAVLHGLISFKSTRGAFARRRMKGFLRDCQAKGWWHADDLAIGALHLGA